MDYLISMYIDNELSIDDKIIFVEHVHAEQGFTDDTVAFLEQEKALRSALPEQAPEVALPFMPSPKLSFLAPKPLGLAFAASCLSWWRSSSRLPRSPKQIFNPQLRRSSTGLSYTSPASARLKSPAASPIGSGFP